MAMNIQIFGTSKSFDTKKAQRWFKERGGRCHFQADAVRGVLPLPAASGFAAVIRAGGLFGLPQSGP